MIYSLLPNIVRQLFYSTLKHPFGVSVISYFNNPSGVALCYQSTTIKWIEVKFPEEESLVQRMSSRRSEHMSPRAVGARNDPPQGQQRLHARAQTGVV